jgi:cytochrome c peroxidase
LKINRHHTILFLSMGLILAGCSSSTTTSPTNNTNATSTTNPSSTTTTASDLIPSLQLYTTPTGTVSTYSSTGSVDANGIFFQKLGTNARTCGTCHQLSQGMSISTASTQALFTSTNGTDPLFEPVDGANCPTVATGDIIGYSLVLNNGLIRIAVELPASAQFGITSTQDPYGCAVTPNSSTGQPIVSVYRRPLPSTNLTFLSNVMWDTRETISPLNAAATFTTNLNSDLSAQAAEAVATHEQGSSTPTAAQLAQLVAFEQGLYTAQATDSQAGSLSSNGAGGGAASLAAQSYYPGVNDALGHDPQGVVFNPTVFTLFQAWRNSPTPQQASIARGEDIFNTAPMNITGVRGLNDNPAIGSPAVIHGSCSTCHDTPNVGTHSFPLPLDTGTSHLAASETNASIIAGVEQLTAPNLPIYQITGCTDANGNPVVYVTTDPGTGLFTGLCADVNRVKVPALRGLAARAPYFHNGSAGNLGELVNFYNARFQMNLNPPQLTDLENFLNAL